MKIEKKYRFIEIKTKDLGKYTDIALLVDNLDFISEIERVRNDYKELNLTYPLSEKDKSLAKKFRYRMQYEDKALEKKFKIDIERIRKLFKRPPHFRNVIEASIIFGEVNESDYSKAYLEKQAITPTKGPNDVPDVKYCIVIHSSTRPKDIQEVFNKFKKDIWVNFKASDKEKDGYNFGYWFDFSLTKPNDTRETIRRLSNYYRQRKNGVKPMEMAFKILHTSKSKYREALWRYEHHKDHDDKEFKKDKSFVKEVERTRDNIKSLIRRYSHLLETPNTIL